VKIVKSKDSSYIIRAKVIEVPESESCDKWKEIYLEFRDLAAEASEKCLYKLMNEYLYLFQGQNCPRCKKSGEQCLEQLCALEQHVRY